MFTPKSVIENATPDTNEILVVGVDEQGIPQNVLLRDHAALRAQLVATPPQIVNPARGPLEQQAFDAATAQVVALEASSAAAAVAVPAPAIVEQPATIVPSTPIATS